MLFLYDHTSIEPIQRVAFTLFGIDVYWYGICIAIGATLALLLGLRTAKYLKVDQNALIDGFLWGLIVGVLGARIWYVIFEWDQYADNPISIITGFRDGGLAIHGAVYAAAIYAFIYCKVKKINFIKVLEMLAPGFLIGQICGRWGNFFNQEAHGGLVPGATLDAQREWLLNHLIPKFITDQMYITDLETGVADQIGYYHPTFYYEFLWNVVGLAGIFLARRFWKKYWIGDAAIVYLIWYSIGRFMIEALRTDSLYVFGLRTAQLTSVIMFVAGVVLLILRRIYRVYPISFCGYKGEA
jgi:phosphatidylglycerol:prolipoprotein diacylglycerol transferase